MSLTAEFFIKRQSVMNEYVHKGYVDLDSFMATYSLSLDQLQNAGFIEPRPILSTADLYDFHITTTGRNYIHTIRSEELYLVKPNCSDALAQEILNTTK